MALLNLTSFGGVGGFSAPAAPFLTTAAAAAAAGGGGRGGGGQDGEGGVPGRPPGYTRIDTSARGSRTSIHAVIDYDEDDLDDYYDDEEDVGFGDAAADGRTPAAVTPIQGPIFVRNGSVPVVPLYSYPQLHNGSFVQIPFQWNGSEEQSFGKSGEVL